MLAALFLALLFTLLLPCACHPPPAGGAATTKSQETENLLSKITNPNPKYRYKYRVQILIQIHFTRPLVNKIRRNFRKSQPNYFQKSQIRKRNTYTFTYIQTDTSSLKHYGLQTKLLYQNEDIEVVLSAKGARTKWRASNWGPLNFLQLIILYKSASVYLKKNTLVQWVHYLSPLWTIVMCCFRWPVWMHENLHIVFLQASANVWNVFLQYNLYWCWIDEALPEPCLTSNFFLWFDDTALKIGFGQIDTKVTLSTFTFWSKLGKQ